MTQPLEMNTTQQATLAVLLNGEAPISVKGWLARLCSVVYAGMGTQALKARIEDAHAKVVVCSDFTFRRDKKIPLKPTVDEAVRDLTFVDHVEIRATLPKTRNGKIVRRALRAEALGQDPGDLSTLAD